MNWQISQFLSGRHLSAVTDFLGTLFHSFMYSCSLLPLQKTQVFFGQQRKTENLPQKIVITIIIPHSST